MSNYRRVNGARLEFLKKLSELIHEYQVNNILIIYEFGDPVTTCNSVLSIEGNSNPFFEELSDQLDGYLNHIIAKDAENGK